MGWGPGGGLKIKKQENAGWEEGEREEKHSPASQKRMTEKKSIARG